MNFCHWRYWWENVSMATPATTCRSAHACVCVCACALLPDYNILLLLFNVRFGRFRCIDESLAVNTEQWAYKSTDRRSEEHGEECRRRDNGNIRAFPSCSSLLRCVPEKKIACNIHAQRMWPVVTGRSAYAWAHLQPLYFRIFFSSLPLHFSPSNLFRFSLYTASLFISVRFLCTQILRNRR